MSSKWKIPAIAAGGAFLLSLLIGVAGRVVFGSAILRAFIWAIVFAALAFGVDLLLRKYLPELLTGESEETASHHPSVDITLDDENPVMPGSTQESEESGYEENGVAEAERTRVDDEGEFGAADAEEAVEIDQVDEPGRDSVSRTADESEDTGEAEFSDFASVETALGSSGGRGRAEAPQSANIDFLGIDEDPATVAKAVRTFMKKDQEG